MAESALILPDIGKQKETLDAGTLREYEPLTDLLSQIPKKVQRGLQTQTESLEISCIDANQDYIALGSNVGVVFLYDRSKHTIERLRSDDKAASVNCVCLHHGLDHLVAIGYMSGEVYLFQLPSMLIGHSKQLERFVVRDLHSCPVRSLAWSTNGMKLYSGDTRGSVGCMEVDFYEGQCKSSTLLIENETEIIQLDTAHKSLLISTRHRCLICRLGNKDQLIQVGSKDRKVIDNFGAVFIPAMCKPEDAQLYCARPGFRIWKGSINGTVNNTFMFKDLLSQPHNQIPVGAFVVTSIEKGVPATQFGPLLLYMKNYLVTWNQSCLYVLDPENSMVVGSQKYIGKIQSVVATGNEIFVLRRNTNRELIRISTEPLPVTGSRILRELHDEKDRRENQELRAQRDDKSSSKNSSTESLTDKPKDKKTSPLKFLQENLVEKMKKIPKPNEIKEKIQKMNRDSQGEPSTSKYNQEYVFDRETSSNEEIKTVSVASDLPPVIKLDSPDLMSIEVAIDAIKMDMKKRSSVEQFASLVDSESQQNNEAETMSYQSTSKTGSGAHSALKRLQSEHLEEENSDTVLHRKSFSEDSVELTTSDLHSSNEIKTDVSDTGQSFPLQTATAVMPEEEGIVFSRKIKHKGKKKKKASKDKKTSPLLEVDQDNISVSSFTSNTSNTSDSNEISSNLGDMDNNIKEEVNSKPSESEKDLNNIVNDHIKADKSFTIDTSAKEGHKLPVTHSEFSKDDDKIIENEERNVVEANAEAQGNDEIDFGSEQNTEENQESVNLQNINVDSSDKTICTAEQDVCNKESKVNSDSSEKLTVEVTNENSVISDNNSEINQTKPNPQIYVEGYDSISSKSSGTESDTVSTLDKEIARLNSYLSETSDCSTSEQESTPQSLSSSIRARKEVESILLKNSQRYQDLEDEITRNYGKNQTEYKESDLDKQLKQLDFEASSSSDMGTVQSPVFSPDTSPSIYTLYKMPSISQDDIYGEYSPKSLESESSISAINLPSEKKSFDSMTDSVHVSDTPRNPMMGKSVNMWTEISAQGNLLSLCASSTHVWYTDKSCNIWYSGLTGPGLTWRKASGYATQVAVSPLGNIVWRLYKGVAYAGTKITTKSPEGLKWAQAVQADVAYICVDETCAWYIKTNYEVMLQKNLSRDRPCYTSKPVDCPFKLKQIMCQSGVVWALTEEFQWIYREGVTKKHPEGNSWKKGVSGSENRLFTCLSLGDGNVGWAIDVLGCMWFICGVTMETPRGTGIWWQVPFSGEYLMKDVTTMDMLKSFTKKFDPQNLAYILSHQRGGLVCGRSAVWFCPEYKHLLHVCRGSIEGHYWGEAQPEGLPTTLVWKHIEARNVRSDKGLLWVQQGSGDIFTYTQDRQNCGSVQSPHPGSTLVCISACPEAVWVLLDTGAVYIRTGIGPIYPQGGGWFKLDLTQIENSYSILFLAPPRLHSCLYLSLPRGCLGPTGHRAVYIRTWIGPIYPQGGGWFRLDLTQIDTTHFVHLSCGNMNVWAVDNEGGTYHRIGVKAPNDHSLNAAWLPVDNSGTVFTQILAGPQDWMVWAIDNRRQVYVRSKITSHMPIGRQWVHVPGTLVSQLALADHYVWALSPSGELLCRYGVTEQNVTGDYWKRFPGTFAYISVSPSNQLWGITKEGQLLRRHVKYILKDTALDTGAAAQGRGPSVGSDEGDWELV